MVEEGRTMAGRKENIKSIPFAVFEISRIHGMGRPTERVAIPP